MKTIFKGMDKPLLIITIILFAMGLVTIYSASNVTAFMQNEADPSRYFMKELLFIGVGFFFSLLLIRIPTKKYFGLSWIAVIALGIIIVLVTLLGTVVNGMSGWINYNGFGIQPSEFVKIAIIPLIATFYDVNQKYKDNFSRMMVPMIVSIIVTVIIVCQGDLGTAIIFFGLCLLMFFFSPVSRRIKFKIFTFGCILAVFLAIFILAFGDTLLQSKMARFDFDRPCSEEKYYTTGNQLCNGYIAINGGGLLGKGIGNSTQKYLYLPEGHTDFIFAIFVEELGLVGAFVLFVLYILLLVRIIAIGKHAKTIGNSLICYGVSFYIFMHIIVNLTGVLGILPMTGVPLPFMSYGGSVCLSLILSLTLVQRVAFETKRS